MPAALILAGGASTRMGRDKASVEVDGQVMLARVVEIVSRRCQPVVVSARRGQRLPALELAFERVDDPPARAGGGPLVGIVAGLDELAGRGAELAYLGSCDAVALSEDHVAFMLAALVAAPAASLAIVRDDQGRLHPLAAAVRVEPMRRHCEAALARGDRRLQRVFGSVEASVILDPAALPEPAVLAPCNTPAELAAARELL